MTEQAGAVSKKYNAEQYNRLIRCAEEGNMSGWNQWRIEHAEEEIHLDGALLVGKHLCGADLHDAYLREANFSRSHVDSTLFENAKLQGAIFEEAHLANPSVRIPEMMFSRANLECAIFVFANLEGIVFMNSHLENADFTDACLKGAVFKNCHLEGSSFCSANCDASTLFSECHVDRRTDFSVVGLSGIRIDSGTRLLLEYNERKRNWKKYYSEHKLLGIPARGFWWVSDYGKSTIRIVGSFFIVAFIFALVYWLSIDSSVVANLKVEDQGLSIGPGMHFARAFYFSIVTMTTLGFGDMYAGANSWVGYVLLTLQVLFGYSLLGALVSRFSILFTAGGPAGRFSRIDSRKLLSKQLGIPESDLD